MGEDDVWRAVHGFIIRAFKTFAFDRRMQQRIDLMHEMGDVLVGNVAGLVVEQVVDAYEQIGDRVQPREPRIFLEEVDEDVDGGHRPAEELVGLLLGDNERAVQPHEAFPDGAHDAPAVIDRNQRG